LNKLILALAGLVFGSHAVPAAIVTHTVEYSHDGVMLEGYLAYDDSRSDLRPGILVVHQWKGLSENERMRARMLAELGYVAFAADVYGQGVRPETTEAAGREAGKYYGDRQLWRARLAAALAQLKADPHVDAAHVAAIGYCFGGGGVLELARSGARVNGVVSFHGSLDTPDPADARNITAKVLVCHGASDDYVTHDKVLAFLDEMDAAGVDYQFNVYHGAEHGFTQQGPAYQADADRRSWRDMQNFFDEIFR
jgi:dienelactone hydrolase